MYIYILTGKLFGKDIYEIDAIGNCTQRLESTIYGYPKDNKILFIQEIKFYNELNFKNCLEKFKLHDNIYKLNLNTAINIILSNLKIYDIEPEPDIVVKSRCSCFSY